MISGTVERNLMMKRANKTNAAFTMIEIAIVVAIVGILGAIATVGFMRQIDQSRINSASSVINAHLLQARQSAIATRETRRVAIYVGELENASDGELSGGRIARGQIWIEGRRCEKFNFSEPAYCENSSGNVPNVIELTDTEQIPDGVTIASVGDIIVGTNGNQTLYIEFNPRGQATKAYFAGDESNVQGNLATATELAIHIIRDNEFFETPAGDRSYVDLTNNLNASQWRFTQDENSATERFKIKTIEIIRLTGKTRVYPFGIFGFWPSDEFTS